MKKLLIIAGVLVVGVIVGALVFSKPPVVITGSSGANFAAPQFFNSGLYSAGFKDFNGTDLSLTGVSTKTLTAAQVCENPVIRVAFNTATGTVTLPSAANFIGGKECLTDLGDVITVSIVNASGTGVFDLAVGASSSLALINATSTLGSAYATSSIPAKGLGELRGRLFTSSTAWVLWTVYTAK